MKNAVPSLTGLRFVAAMSVVSGHLFAWMVKTSPNPVVDVLANLSGIGMTLFFVLSGFVIHMNYSEAILSRTGLWNFAVARFARLYPLYFVLMCYDLALTFGFHNLRIERLAALPYYATLTQSWFYKPIDGAALVYQFGHVPQVAWSISTEWFFYFAFPLLCIGLVRLKSARVVLIATAVLCLVGLIGSYAIGYERTAIEHFGGRLFGEIGASWQDGFYRWLSYFSPYARIFEFTLGCLVSALVKSLPPPPDREQRYGLYLMGAGLVWAIALQIYLFGFPVTWATLSLHMNFGFAPPVAIIIFGCARYQNAIVRALSTNSVVMAGEASYSIYLSHMVVINAFRYESPPFNEPQAALAAIMLILAATASVVGLSFLLWHRIEMPARRAIRNALEIKTRPELLRTSSALG